MIAEEDTYKWCLLTLFLIGPPTYLSLQFTTAPYGRHRRSGWGPTLPPSLAWFLMESPTLFLSLLILPFGRHRSSLRSLSLLSVFLLHYSHRTLLYPIRLHFNRTAKSSPRFPISVALFGFVFNLLNAYVQSRWVSHYGSYDADELFWPRFGLGFAVFAAGMAVNVWADSVLVALKAEGGGYKVPRGGVYEVVSCPNYLGEMVEWLGWAVMTWSWAGFGFFLTTCANLVPRARANHVWYLHKFGEDYPRYRKAVIPFLY